MEEGYYKFLIVANAKERRAVFKTGLETGERSVTAKKRCCLWRTSGRRRRVEAGNGSARANGLRR